MQSRIIKHETNIISNKKDEYAEIRNIQKRTTQIRLIGIMRKIISQIRIIKLIRKTNGNNNDTTKNDGHNNNNTSKTNNTHTQHTKQHTKNPTKKHIIIIIRTRIVLSRKQ